MSAGRVLLGMVLGALGGALAWLLNDPILSFLVLGRPMDPPAGLTGAALVEWSAANQWRVYVAGNLLGLGLGLALGIGEGIVAGTTTRFWRAVGIGAAVGVVGGFLGMVLGQYVFSMIGGKIVPERNDLAEFFHMIVARSVGWTMIGLLLGLILGITGGSPQRARNGAVGGAIGGAIGGFVFQALAFTGAFEGVHLRLIGFSAIGASVGFFVNLVDEALKRAWVKVLVGRNEGKEFLLDRPVTVLGRDELVDVPIFLDPQLARRHATIRRQERAYYLCPEPNCPLALNGRPVTGPTPLADGDLIQLGKVTVAFYSRDRGAPAPRPVDAAAPPPSPPPVPAGVCPYCGQALDPVTGACACRPGDSVPAIAPAPTGGTAAATPRLVAVAGALAGRSFDLAGAGVTLGRAPDRTIVLAGDALASRVHARIDPVPGGYLLRDEGSSNGTFVNGVRVTEHLLRPGDAIRIGSSEFRFEA